MAKSTTLDHVPCSHCYASAILVRLMIENNWPLVGVWIIFETYFNHIQLYIIYVCTYISIIYIYTYMYYFISRIFNDNPDDSCFCNLTQRWKKEKHNFWLEHIRNLWSFNTTVEMAHWSMFFPSKRLIHTMWVPLVISWFINPSNYGYNFHKP